MSRGRSAALLAAITAVTALAGPAATAGADVVVCNEAQSSWQGTWDATASTDPLPPARHKSAAMAVGKGKGLVNAAAHSPALAVCVPTGAPSDDGGEV